MASPSPLESLPRELLQKIFVANVNLNLIFASPLIGAQLSTPFVYTKVCDHYFTNPEIAPSRRSCKPNIAEQNFLLSRRWMTWDFFRGYVAGRISRNDDVSVTTKRALTTLFAKSTWVEDDWRNLETSNVSIDWMATTMPLKLLRKPWPQPKLHFLRFLILTTSISIDRGSKDALRCARQAKRDAVAEGNLDAVLLFSRIRRLGNAPDLELVKYAVIEAGCDRRIVYELMRSARAWGLRRWADADLDAWVADAERQENGDAAWVMARLDELRAGRFPTDGSIEDQTMTGACNNQEAYQILGDLNRALIIHPAQRAGAVRV